MKSSGVFLAFCWATISLACAGTLAQFRTRFGDIAVELYDQDKPVTVQNFIRYVRSGAYSNTFMHRCLPGFIVQGGGFLTTNQLATNLFTVFDYVRSFGTITNEFNSGPHLSNTNATIAMAKISGDPNSASSQWFFNLGDNSANLDTQNGGFTVFGRVVQGTNTLNIFSLISQGNGIVDLRKFYGTNSYTSLFSDLPVAYGGQSAPDYNDLIYADLSLLTVNVRPTSTGEPEISWTSVSNKVNKVEFSSDISPVWQSLMATNGTGGELTWVDSSATNRQRFYRVRVDY
jgi:cyclophilin family peptidyl-prolyl cis-trans isomerase